MLKRRLQNKVKELRKDLGQLEVSKDKDSNFRHWERLERKYSIRVRLNVAIEELKQRITATAAKVRRYQGRVDKYRSRDEYMSRDFMMADVSLKLRYIF